MTLHESGKLASQYQLSICIPTYNRAHLLEKACRRLIDEIARRELSERVQICISDNGSSDNTVEVVERLQKQGVDICFHRQTENKGFSRNLQSVIQMAEGEYVLLAGDDDLLCEGALGIIIAAANMQEDIVIFNSLSGVWPGPLAEVPPSFNASPVPMRGATQVNDLLGIFHLSFIGNILIRKSIYLKYDNPRFLFSAYPHTCVLLEALCKTSMVYVNTANFLVDESHRVMNDSLLACVDMARVQTECVLRHGAPRQAIAKTYGQLVRSVPRSVLKEREGVAVRISGNPFADLSLSNVLDCYRCSVWYRIVAATMWTIAKIVPKSILKRMLER